MRGGKLKVRHLSSGGARSLVALGCILAGSASAVAQAKVAGTVPDRRPEGAPKLTAFAKPADWSAKWLVGVEQPHPASLRFLNDQGAWFTPFTRPGMTGPYDIRKLHGAKAGGRSQAQAAPKSK